MPAGQHATGYNAPRLPVGDHRQPQGLGAVAGGRLGPAKPHVRAEDQDRPPGTGQQPGHLIEPGLGGARSLGTFRRGDLDLALVVNRLQREVQEDRPAPWGSCQRERLVDRGRDLELVMFGPGALGDRGQQRHVVHLLQRAGTPQVVRRPAADHHQGRAVEVSAGHRADAVGDAGTRGDHGQARVAGQPAGGLGGEHGGLLVPHVDQPHRRRALDGRVVEREHVAAGEGEHDVHPVPLGNLDGVVAPMPG